ncbi:MAG: zf-HC2 domain-containing protein [Phycisphaerae bacterium]|nr:zf-HC2 domain-containing protein [Phycisphaerae bacterium]
MAEGTEAYVGAPLSVAEKDHIEAHLAGCAGCPCHVCHCS